MKRWWKEKDFVNLFSEQAISKDMMEDEVVEMILHDIEI
jgi:hypothetical protein